MKITDVDVQVVNLPLTNPFTSSFETKTGETRTVVRLRTDTGAEGWGETMWGRPVAELARKLGAELVGTSPFALEAFHRRHHMVPFFHGYLGYAALAALDVACWDLMGKITGQSVTDLLGGPVRDEVPITALVTRADAPGASGRELAQGLGEHAAKVVAEGGFTAVKLKGTKDVRVTSRSCASCGARCRTSSCAWTRTRRGRCPTRSAPGCPWRSSTWSTSRTRVSASRAWPRCGRGCGSRCAPTCAWSASRSSRPAVRLGAVDVIHGDVYKWGGISATKALAAHCETFGLGMNLHSGGELGIATAAHLAVVASTPVLSRAIDSMYYLHADDIVEPLELSAGRLKVPSGPGLGVTVDEEKLAFYAERNRKEGDLTG